MQIRVEKECDREAVRAVNISAFETTSEADLVDALRQQAHPIISLVAEENGEVVGHILFSPVSLSGQPNLKVMGLAPMAVAPSQQKKGTGSALVQSGLDHCRKLGFVAVVVLGHPQYYPRFGFSPASQFGVDSEYDVPDEVFMAMELQPDALSGIIGTVRYHSAFSNI
jgi:putative acetyltransferase